MLASSVLLISGLVAGAHGALMPRQSSTTAPTGCWRCPTGHIDDSTYGQIGADGSLLCMYDTFWDGEIDALHCAFDETGTPIAPSDAGCGGAPATLAMFQCPSAGTLVDFLNFNGGLECGYLDDLGSELTCDYDSTGHIGANPDGLCPTIALNCVSTTRRSYMADNNFAAVERRQAARAAALITLTSRRLTPDNKK